MGGPCHGVRLPGCPACIRCTGYLVAALTPNITPLLLRCEHNTTRTLPSPPVMRRVTCMVRTSVVVLRRVPAIVQKCLVVAAGDVMSW